MNARVIALVSALGASMAYGAVVNPSFEEANPAVTDARIPQLLAQTIYVLSMDQASPGGDGGAGVLIPLNSLKACGSFGRADWLTGYWVASEGIATVELDGPLGGLCQVVDTTPGVMYEVLFDLSGNPWENPGETAGGVQPRPLSVEAGTGTPTVTAGVYSFNSFKTQQYVFDAGQIVEPSGWPDPFGSVMIQDMKWSRESFIFTAQAAQTTLVFRNTTPDLVYAGPTIDNVTMVVVPEPTTTAALLLGGLALIRRRRRR